MIIKLIKSWLFKSRKMREACDIRGHLETKKRGGICTMNNIEKRKPTTNMEPSTMVAMNPIPITDTPTNLLWPSLTSIMGANLLMFFARTFDAHCVAPVKLSQLTITFSKLIFRWNMSCHVSDFIATVDRGGVELNHHHLPTHESLSNGLNYKTSKT